MVDHLIQSYQSVVSELVEYQSMSWLYSLGYRSLKTIEDQQAACPKPVTTFTVQPTYRKRPNATLFNADGISDNSGILWDDEHEIETYFERLLQLCGDDFNSTNADKKNKQEYPSSQQQQNTTKSTNLSKCWSLLHSLVHDALCTTRMDSRTVCRRDATSRANVTSHGSVWKALKSHHANSTEALNIIIVGAGPVGLLAANAFSKLDLKTIHGAESDNPSMPIRVTVFENRASAPGVKLPYTRGWGYAPDLSHLGAIADERIVQLFYALGSPTEAGEEATWANIFSIPINILETLLLLSNRQRRDVVQLIYGEDVTQYISDLPAQIPNLLVLDATGHRLQTLERGSACQQGEHGANDHGSARPGQDLLNVCHKGRNSMHRERLYGINGSLFRSPPLQDANEWCWFPPEYFPSLHAQGHVPEIVEADNSLLFPIHPDTRQPLASYWMHVHDLPATCSADDSLKRSLAQLTDTSTSQLCQSCQKRTQHFDASIKDSVDITKQWIRNQEDDGVEKSTTNAIEAGEETTPADRLAQLVEFRGLLGSAKNQTRVETLCSAFCVPNSYYDGTDCYRDEIQKQMTSTHGDKAGPWFTARLVNYNLSPKQAQIMMIILENHGYAADPVGMPVSELPLDLMAQDPVLQENGLLEVLEIVATHAGPKHPTITIFLLRPYLYREALVKPSDVESLLRAKDATTCSTGESKTSSTFDLLQMLRVGDSLLSGDVTLNSGLYTHVFMLAVWMCIIKGDSLRTCTSTLG